MNKKYIIAIIAVLIIICGVFAINNLYNTNVGFTSIDAKSLEDRGNLTVDSESLDESKGLYHTEKSDINPILVKNGGNLKLTNSIINKTGDTKSTGDNADFYGINSAVLVNTNGSLDISNVEINTNSKGSNGIFVTNSEANNNSKQNTAGSSNGGQPPELNSNEGPGNNNSQSDGKPPEIPSGDKQASTTNSQSGGQPPEMPSNDNSQMSPGVNGGGQPGESTVAGKTEAKISNVKITTHSDKSRGLDATYNGKINAENVIINTDGQSCAALATDRGEGEVHVKNSEINTGVSKNSGHGSPLVYSTGNITLENTKGTSYVSQIACIEGKNSISIIDSDLTGYGEGNRKDNDKYVDLGGVFIYQSMSGDADVGTSQFTAKNSKLTLSNESNVYKTAPMFHVTNTACVIDLENTELNFGSGIFLESSSQNQWGNTESNGGKVELNTNNEKIEGNIIVDSISSLNFTMKNTEFKGSINSTGNTTVNIGEGSTWTLTGDSTVTSLSISGDIEYGNYNLIVDGKNYNKSNPYK